MSNAPIKLTTRLCIVFMGCLSIINCGTANTSRSINATGDEAQETWQAYCRQQGVECLNNPAGVLNPSEVLYKQAFDGESLGTLCDKFYPTVLPRENPKSWPEHTTSIGQEGGFRLAFLEALLSASPKLKAGVKNAGSVTIKAEGVVYEEILPDRLAEEQPYHPGCHRQIRKLTDENLRDTMLFVATAVRANSLEITLKFNEGATPANDVRGASASGSDNGQVESPTCGTFVEGSAGIPGKFEVAVGGGQCIEGQWKLVTSRPYYIAYLPWSMDQLNMFEPDVEVTDPKAVLNGRPLLGEEYDRVPAISEAELMDFLGFIPGKEN